MENFITKHFHSNVSEELYAMECPGWMLLQQLRSTRSFTAQ